MPAFRIHKMKEHVRSSFRWAPHTSGVANVKRRDYEESGEIEAKSCYDAWMSLRGAERALDVGDLLESQAGELHICKYVGFEEARWVVPEAKPATEAAPGDPTGDTTGQPA